MRKPALVLLGPPGVGKGTASASLVDRFPELTYVATGDLVRSVLSSEREPLASEFRALLKDGVLIPDNKIVELLEDHLRYAQQSGVYNAENVLLLDGFPRTIGQAQASRNVLSVDQVYRFSNVTPKELKRRVKSRANSLRRQGVQARDDDNTAAVRNRIEEYFALEKTLLYYFNNQHIPVIDIDANHSRMVVAEDIGDQVRKYLETRK